MKPDKISPARISLMEPSWALRESYIECLRDLIAADPTRGLGMRWDWLEKFELYLKDCEQNRAQAGIVNGRAPYLTYWIGLDERQAVGKVTLHTVLSKSLKRVGGNLGFEVRPAFRGQGIAERACMLGLRELARLGLSSAIATCDEENMASRRVLEKCGGSLVDRYEVAEWPKPVLKFEFEFGLA